MASKKPWPPEPFVLSGFVHPEVQKDFNAVGEMLLDQDGLLINRDGTPVTYVSHDLNLHRSRLKKLADGFHIKGDLLVADSMQLLELPRGMIVEGDLIASGSALRTLPADIDVREDIILNDTVLDKLPDNLHVRGNLELSNAGLFELPAGLTVDGHLDMIEMRGPKEIPGDLKVKGKVAINNSTIAWIAPNMTFETLFANHSKLKELPEGLTVESQLDLDGTNLTSLPDDLKLGGSLYLGDVPILKLPDNFHVPGELGLAGSHIRKLPPGLKVGGDLVYDKLMIRELPEDLEVGGRIRGLEGDVPRRRRGRW